MAASPPILLTPGPLTTAPATREAMLRDWGSWDGEFNRMTASVCADLVRIAHGEEDTRVLPSQSKDMVKALKALGKPVEWMPFEQEGHGFFWVDNHVKYYAAVLSFLQRHIGERPVPSPQADAVSGTPP